MLTPEQAAVVLRLHAERAGIDHPVDRIVFDNRRDPALPGLPVGLWLIAFSADEARAAGATDGS